MTDPFLYGESQFKKDIKSGDKRRALEALRDVLAESLDDLHGSIKSNSGLCRRCGGSLSEAGLAALALRLKQTLDDLEAMGDPHKELSILDQLQAKRNQRAADGVAGTTDSAPTPLGTKAAPRRKGGRRTGGLGGAGSGPVGSDGA